MPRQIQSLELIKVIHAVSPLPVFLSVVLVLRNESAGIETTLREVGAVIGRLVSDYEIIVVDNASDDTSIAVLKKLTAEDGLPNLQVYALTKEVDSDTAAWVGLENALGDFVAVLEPASDDVNFLENMLDHAVEAATSCSPPMRSNPGRAWPTAHASPPSTACTRPSTASTWRVKRRRFG